MSCELEVDCDSVAGGWSLLSVVIDDADAAAVDFEIQ